MKAYITCPVTESNKRLEILPIIKSIVEEKNINPFVFIISGTPEEIFKRDYNQLKSCDIIIAEVSETSHGVGIEIGMSYCLNLKRILLHKKDKHISKFAQGMPNTTIIEYDDIDDLKELLSKALDDLEK